MRKAKWVLGWLGVLGLMVFLAAKGGFGILAAEPGASAKEESAPAAQPAKEPEKTTPAEKTQVSPPSVTPEELDQLVQQLDADAFADRQAASQRLAELGRAAIDALIRAAASESLEANVRALDILKKHLDSQDAELKKSAKEALEKIAEGPRPASARRAKDILKAHEEREKLFQQQQANVPGRIQVQAQAQMIGGQVVRRVQIVSNVKTIEGEDKNGKFRIIEDPKEGITVELTRKKDGKEVTEKFQAKNAEELKKKHPEAYEVYKRNSQADGVMIQAGPVAVGQVQAAPAQVVRRNNVQMAALQLPIWIQMVDRLVTDEAIKDSSKQSLEELKKKSEEARQALEKLEKRLQEAIDQKTKEEQKDKQEQKTQEESKNKDEKPQEQPSSEKQS